MPRIFLLPALVASLLASCGGGGGGDTASTSAALDGGGKPKPRRPGRACAKDGEREICLEVLPVGDDEGTGYPGTGYLNPRLKMSGFVRADGTARLYRDAGCEKPVYSGWGSQGMATPTGNSVTIRADTVTKIETPFWAQYSDPDSVLGPCVGPAYAYREDRISLSVVRGETRLEGDRTPTFRVHSPFPAEGGTARLYSDATCTGPASDKFPHHGKVTAYEIEGGGKRSFFVRVAYASGGTSRCSGGTA